MDLSSLLNSITVIVIQLLIYFPLGYMVIGRKLENSPLTVTFIISCALGLTILIVIISIISIFYIGYWNLIIILTISYGILLTDIINLKIHKKPILKQIRQKRTKEDIVIGVMVFLLVIYFANQTSLIGWAPGLDSINHGILTNLLLNNQRLQTTLDPIAPSQPWFEPFGFHTISAHVSLLLNLYAGESMLAFASIISLLTILSCFAIVHYSTKSFSLSLLSVVSCFLVFPNINDIRFLEKWFLGFYYNTPYPNLFGFYFLVQFYFSFFVLRIKEKWHRLLIISLSLLGILLSYTPFVIFPLGFIILEKTYQALTNNKVIERTVRRINGITILNNKRKTTIFAYISLMFLSISSILLIVNYVIDTHEDSNDNKFLTLLDRIKNNSYYYTSIVLNPDSFQNIIGIWTLSLLALSIGSIIKNNRKRQSCFFLILTLILIASSFSNELLNNMLWFMLHGRLFSFMLLLNGIFTALYSYDLSKWVVNKWLKIDLEGKTRIQAYIHVLISATLVIGMFMPSILSNVSLEQSTYWGWMVVNSDFKNDYKLLSWISDNINKTDLIMNDYTYTSKRLLSFSLSNITALPIPISPQEIELAKNNVVVWNKPSLLKSFIERYDIQYVLLDSDPNHRIPPELGGTDENVPRPYNMSIYKEIFSHMPFLSKVKEFGFSTLYKVTD